MLSLTNPGPKDSVQRVLLNPLEDEPLDTPLMRFRLVYEGELKPSQLDPLTGNPDKLAEHKQNIRKVFHKQLKQLWATNRFLREHTVYPSDYGMSPPPSEPDIDPGEWGNTRVPLKDAVASRYHEYDYQFVPLVQARWSLRCAIDVLLLRRDYPGSVISAGDLDNRIKTLIDGLRRPRNGIELRAHLTPEPDETPFYCLLEDDNLITQFSVETDTLLDDPVSADARFARAIITVEIQPYDVTMFNLSFA